MSIDNIKPSEIPQYVFLTGRGRSGTTWLGQILNTDRNCIYKYEPFLPSKSSPFQIWKDRLDGDYDLEEMRSEFWSLCCNCYFGVDNPPFPDKSFRKQSGYLLRLLYGLGKRIDRLQYLYELYGRSQLDRDTAVLIKDVNFPIYLLPDLSLVLQPYLIAMVRNPFANIASYLKGIDLGLFESDRNREIDKLKKNIDTPGGNLASYSDSLNEMSVAQFEAVRWRYQTESLVEYTKNYPKSIVVVYEELCMDPLGITKEIFNFLGWHSDRQTEDFISASTSGKTSTAKASKSYYSVYRDPRKSMSKWKEQLTEAQKSDIQSIVCESHLINLWSDDF